MPRRGITQEAVFQAAEALVSAGKNPTVDTLAAWIGSGSRATLCRHLKTWKMKKFSGNLDPNCGKSEAELERLLHWREGQNETLSLEVAKHNKENTQLKERVKELESEIFVISLRERELKQQFEKIDSNFALIKEERAYFLSQLMESHNRQIEKFQNEIKEINRTALDSIQSTSHMGHEKLIEEKIKTKNLEAKLSEQDKTIQALKNRVRYFEGLKVINPLDKEEVRGRE